jgi:hypothetical protein
MPSSRNVVSPNLKVSASLTITSAAQLDPTIIRTQTAIQIGMTKQPFPYESKVISETVTGYRQL